MVLGGNFRQIFSMIRKRQNMILLFLQLIDPFNRQIVFCWDLPWTWEWGILCVQPCMVVHVPNKFCIFCCYILVWVNLAL